MSSLDLDMGERIVALVREAIPSIEIFDGKTPEVSSRPARFVVVYAPPGTLVSEKVGGYADRQEVSFQVSSFATADDPHQLGDAAWRARWVSRKIRNYLVTKKLVPHGSLISHFSSTMGSDTDLVVSTQAVQQIDNYEAIA